MNKIEFVTTLRSDTTTHWNCCQSVLAAFTEECSITLEQAYKLGAQFGSGMKIGGACGALTGGLMVLGMVGADDAAARSLTQQFKQNHTAFNCPELLKLGAEKGDFNKKAHCDGLVYEIIDQVSSMI
jgi:C_GCAxxG_C_C family probable redox protein